MKVFHVSHCSMLWDMQSVLRTRIWGSISGRVYSLPGIWPDMSKVRTISFLCIVDLTSYTGLAVALQSRLAPFIAQPDLQTDIQPRSIWVLGVPEYYPEYRETGEGFAAFLGSSVVAKVGLLLVDPKTYPDSLLQLTFSNTHDKSFVSKAVHNQKGPRSIIEMSPGLL